MISAFLNLLHSIRKIPKKHKNKLAIRKSYKSQILDTSHVLTDENIGVNLYLYWWPGTSAGRNLGDYLSHVVVSYLAPSNGGCEQITTLYAIGSVLGFRIQKDVVVWGSGFLSKSCSYAEKARLSDMDIRAVRGPLTRRRLRRLGIKCPKVYGDPGLLMPMIYQPTQREKKYAATVIPHYARPLNIDGALQNINVISMLTTDYQSVIDAIVQSDRVISGSLHGIILAEAYGIPAVLVLKTGENSFKYKDYYFGTGRHKIIIAHSVEEALQVSPMPIPDFSSVRQGLLNAFPYDLWQANPINKSDEVKTE